MLAKSLALFLGLSLLAAGWQYRRANASLAVTAAAAQALQSERDEAARVAQQHRAVLRRVHAANAALRVESDRLATSLAQVEDDLNGLLERHSAWAGTRVPADVVVRLREYARAAGGVEPGN